MVRFCGNFYFNWRYCGFKTLSGVRLLQPLSHVFIGVIQVSAVITLFRSLRTVGIKNILTGLLNGIGNALVVDVLWRITS